MAVPKQRKTKGRRNQRRMHIHLENPPIVDCPQCKEKKIMHALCDSCGYYKGREVVDVLKKDKDKEKEVKKQDEGKEKSEKEKTLDAGSLSKKKK